MIRVYWKVDILTTGTRESLGVCKSWQAADHIAAILREHREQVEMVRIGRLP